MAVNMVDESGCGLELSGIAGSWYAEMMGWRCGLDTGRKGPKRRGL